MTTKEEMIASIGAELFRHRLVVVEGRSQCKCGWWVAPLLDSVHRLHQAEEILAAVLMATAQLNGERLAEGRERLQEEWQLRTEALGRLLLDSGDITPMGTRMLTKIWEPAGEVT